MRYPSGYLTVGVVKTTGADIISEVALGEAVGLGGGVGVFVGVTVGEIVAVWVIVGSGTWVLLDGSWIKTSTVFVTIGNIEVGTTWPKAARKLGLNRKKASPSNRRKITSAKLIREVLGGIG